MIGRLKRVVNWFTRRRADHSNLGARRGARTHVIVLDGTMSSLEPGRETNAGITYKLLREMNGQLSVFYEAGIQWQDWKTTTHVMMGRGINRQIRRAYGFLASRYRPGDRIFLFGYSRGAYAVRSLAGVIDRVGLLTAEQATERNILQVYRHYQQGADSPAAHRFAELYCHPETRIEMIGAWDTVAALGLRLPLLWPLAERRHGFHNCALGPSIKAGFHALARDETREVFQPIMWTRDPAWEGRLEQVWFRGTHGDVGGQLGGEEAARPLANIPLVWMLERAEQCGLSLPEGWHARFPQDAEAPSVGTWQGWGKIFVLRRRRVMGRDPSEREHETAQILPRPTTAATLAPHARVLTAS